MRKFLMIFLAGLCLSTTAFSARIFPEHWTLFSETEHVKIYIKSADCTSNSHGSEMQNLLVKVENKTDKEVFVNFAYENTYSEGTKSIKTNPNDDENVVRVVVKPSATLEGVCYPTELNNQMLTIFLDNKAVKGMTKLEKFSIVSLKSQIIN
jgi:hypothetical protein